MARQHQPESLLQPVSATQARHLAELETWTGLVAANLDSRRAPNAADVALAVQGIQRALCEPGEVPNITQLQLPGMAARARAHSHASSFRDATEGQSGAIQGVWSRAGELVKEVDVILYAFGRRRHPELQASSGKPSSIARAFGGKKIQSLLQETVFGPYIAYY